MFQIIEKMWNKCESLQKVNGCVALGFALETCCARGLELHPCDLLRLWPQALPSRLELCLWHQALHSGTCCECGLGLCPRDLLGLHPQDSLHLWPWASPLGLTALVALGFALGTCCACGLGLRPWDLICSYPLSSPSGLALLMALGFPFALTIWLIINRNNKFELSKRLCILSPPPPLQTCVTPSKCSLPPSKCVSTPSKCPLSPPQLTMDWTQPPSE